MINYTPVDGRAPTLSHYLLDGRVLGEGAYATVHEGPRGYVLRILIEGGDSNTAKIDCASYKDLSSFIALTWISEKQQICRNAGTDLYQYFTNEHGSLSLSDFEAASVDLMRLHQRNLYHMDIKPENMACKFVNGKPRLSFIDCDSIANAAGVADAAITYPRENLKPRNVERICPSGKADDEYAFLLLLMMVTAGSFCPVYSRLAKPQAEKEEEQNKIRMMVLDRSTKFAHQFVKPEHRDALIKFINTPTDANALKLPLHETIDWRLGLEDRIHRQLFSSKLKRRNSV